MVLSPRSEPVIFMREFGHFLLRMNNFRDFSQSKSFVNAYPFAKFAKFLLRETHLPYRMYVYAIIIRTGLCAVHIFRVRERERDMCPIMISSIYEKCMYVHMYCMYSTCVRTYYMYVPTSPACWTVRASARGVCRGRDTFPAEGRLRRWSSKPD